MLKKFFCMVALICMFMTMSGSADASYFAAAKRSDTTAYVNGKRVVFLTYDIEGNRYVKIRDVAFALSGTSKQFDVQWSASKGAILLKSGKQYKAVGGEMQRSGEETGIARLSQTKVLLDEKEVYLSIYNFKGVNLYRLRDIGRVIDFSVGWDNARKAITIDTNKKSSEPDMSNAAQKAGLRELDPSKPMVALTFDDGPGSFTGDILDTLEKNKSAATFFVIGNRVYANRDTISRAYNMGCEIGGHSWSHPLMTSMSEDQIRTEIQDANIAIEAVTGTATLFYRPTYGAENDRIRSVAQSLGLSLIMWSDDTRDWQSRNSAAVYDSVMRNVGAGDIILFHDIHETTAKAIKRIVPDLISQGYQLVTVSELLYYSGKTLEPGSVYFSGR